MGHDKGFFQGANILQFRIKTDQGTPNVAINIGSGQQGCQPQQLQALSNAADQQGWSLYTLSLGQVCVRLSCVLSGAR